MIYSYKYENIHILQSDAWAEFKTLNKTKAVRVGDIYFTKHKIPFINYYVGFAPKINFYSQKFTYKELKAAAIKERCIAIKFDTPNVIVESTDTNKKYEAVLRSLQTECVLASKNHVTRYNVLLDLDRSLDDIIANFEQKARYNVKIASKKGVEIVLQNDIEALKEFYFIYKETADRVGYMVHSYEYFVKCFEVLRPRNMINILLAKYEGKAIASWVVLNNDDTIYYPFGGSLHEHRSLQASSLLCFETIKLAKKMNLKMFDMWGATNDPNSDYWGFTHFKLAFGGELTKYMDTYDFVINKPLYDLYNFAYNNYFRILKLIKFKKTVKSLKN